MASLKLMSCDGQLFTIDTKVIFCSKMIKTMCEDLGFDNGNGTDEDIIPLPNINAEIFEKVLEWAIHHQQDPPPGPVVTDENGVRRTDDISSWDKEFLKVDQPMLFQLILAANYLDIPALLDTTCKVIANMIKGKTARQIQHHFELTSDLTEIEVVQIHAENEWCDNK